MTQDEIIALAKRVGFPIHHPEWRKAVEEFAALLEEQAAAKEREACVKEIEIWEDLCPDAQFLANKIKEMGQA